MTGGERIIANWIISCEEEFMNVLLHTCCAPCTTHCAETLRELGHNPALFFSNANIAPEREYFKRLAEVKKLAKIVDIALYIDETDHSEWLDLVAKGYEDQPEKGARCPRCFDYALRRTFNKMAELQFDAFTTTLTVSPHKNSKVITEIGRRISPEFWLDVNFKKRDGFKRSLELSEEYELYRQSYCGCEFSPKL